jgi:hypothetical protein
MVGRVLWFRTEVDSENSSVKIVEKMQSRAVVEENLISVYWDGDKWCHKSKLYKQLRNASVPLY